MRRERFYRPVERGFERDLIKRQEYWEKLRAKRQQPRAAVPRNDDDAE
jgi:putative ATPase